MDDIKLNMHVNDSTDMFGRENLNLNFKYIS